MENEDLKENQEDNTECSLESRIQEKIDQEVTRRNFFKTTAKWSAAVVGLVAGGIVTSSLQGCGSSYSRYSRYVNYSNYVYSDYVYSDYVYSDYANITYCNGCAHDYVTTPTTYCNYSDYVDLC
jgi:hypothetical protein